MHSLDAMDGQERQHQIYMEQTSCIGKLLMQGRYAYGICLIKLASGENKKSRLMSYCSLHLDHIFYVQNI